MDKEKMLNMMTKMIMENNILNDVIYENDIVNKNMLKISKRIDECEKNEIRFFFVVLNEKNEVKGIVTATELHNNFFNQEKNEKLTFGDISNKNPVRARQKDTIEDTMKKLIETKVSVLIVTDEKGVYIGKITLNKLPESIKTLEEECD